MLLPWFHQLDLRLSHTCSGLSHSQLGMTVQGHLWLEEPCTAPDTPSNLA